MRIFSRIISKIRFKINPINESRRIGVAIGSNCRVLGKVDWGSEPYLVSIGNHVSITSSSFITHDGGVWVFRDKYPNIDVISPIKIGNNVFIGSGCIILPGSIIEDNVVVGAGSVVKGILKANGIYAGVPAKYIKDIKSYYNGIKDRCLETKGMCFEEKRTLLIDKFITVDRNKNKQT